MEGSEVEVIRHALSVARENGFSEVELEVGSTRFRGVIDAVRKVKRTATDASSGTEPSAPSEPALIEITAPMVGYYRNSQTPLKVGQTVDRGSIVAAIAALGLANDVESPASGEIVEVNVSENEPVQYGQVLAKVKVSS